MDVTTDFYDRSYAEHPEAHRRYPNEEFCRFMGRHFFGVPKGQRGAIKILEVGCGSGANLWLPAREGFDTYGLDFSAEGLRLAERLLAEHRTRATLAQGRMTYTPYPANHFDAVVDVFSASCMATVDFDAFLGEVARILKPGGRFFSYYPSANCDAFAQRGGAPMLDSDTLDGITRETAPYAGNPHPLRFTTPERYAAALQRHGMTSTIERVGRTYRERAEYWEFLVVDARK